MRSFGELLAEYMERTGIADAELARSVGVRRQTIFRWKEGIVGRPRQREDVLRCAQRLRLTETERDDLLMAAGFAPEDAPAGASLARMGATPSQIEPVVEPGTALASAPAILVSRKPLPSRLSRSRLLSLGALATVAILLWRLWGALAGPSYPIAGAGETLVVVGHFANYTGGQQGYNVAGRIQAALDQEIQTAQLSAVRVALWPQPIVNQAGATVAIARSNAAIVIWGEYDSGRVLARFTVAGGVPVQGDRYEELLVSPSDLSATINHALPQEVRYVALVTLGQLYGDGGHFDQARAVLERALTQPPTEPDALAALYFRLGYVYQVGEPADLAAALDAYTQAIHLQPQRTLAYFNRGLAYVARARAGDLDRALADLTHTIRAEPAYTAAYIGRGVAYFQRNGHGDTERAITDFDRALAQAPDAFRAYYNRGLAYIRLDRPQRWQADLEQAMSLAPEFVDVYNALCWAYALDQQPEQALPHCNRAIELGSSIAYDSRGIAHAQLQEYGLAAADFDRFLAWLETQPAGSPYQAFRPVIDAWMRFLERGENPIDATTLARLRAQ